MGCVVGEVIGMVTAASVGLDHEGMSSWSIAVAFLLGYGVTSLRLITQARLGAVLWIGIGVRRDLDLGHRGDRRPGNGVRAEDR